MNRNNGWLPALLGFAIGAMVVALISLGASRRQARFDSGKWQKLNYILGEVDRNYVDTIDYAKVTDEVLASALQHLDPHSVYFEPKPFEEAEADLAGGFEGVGIQFNVPNDTAVVLSVIAGGPSEKAGIITGDRILKVNDIVIAGTKTPQDSMVRLMKGPKGTKVTLTIGRDSETIPFDIVRDKIPENCVDAAFMINDTTAYLRLSKFSRNTYKECAKAMLELREKGMKKLIFDVRENTGGYFDQACNLANLFLDKDELIVYTEGLHRSREEYKANGLGLFRDTDLRILINDGSASASEILAGAIQDNDRGVIVGRRSFGKGLVQEPMMFSDGSGIRLTVARFYTPSGRCIQKPYSDDYAYDLYKRYDSGELMSADSIKVDSTKVFTTRLGRKVYGGGGIIPDVFVPLDTTKATSFHIACNRKALVVRYANRFFDKHRTSLLSISDFNVLTQYLESMDLDRDFLRFAASQGVVAAPGEWEQSKEFLMPQIMGLCGRYSKVGEEAYYRFILPMDTIVSAAL